MFKFVKYQKLIIKPQKFPSNLEINSIKNSNKSFFKSPKRFQSNMNNPLLLLPPITRYILIANASIYGIGMFMNNADYIKTFFYQKYAMRHRKYHVLLTTHFAKANFFDFAIESLMIGMLGMNLEPMMTSPIFLRLMIASVGISSLLLLTMHKEESFFKSEAIFRALIMMIVFKNPQQTFMLFPIPLSIKAYYIGILLVFLDFYSQKWGNFGGTGAAYLMSIGLI